MKNKRGNEEEEDMTIRRNVSLHFQKVIMDVIDEVVIGNEDFALQGEHGPDVPDDIPYWMEYKVYQQRPYSFVTIDAWNNDEEVFWSMGFSKCIGVHKGKEPDKWDAREGIRLAVARAATDIGEKIEKYEMGEEE